MKIAIIGGGLAGTACAYVLKQAGATPILFEASASLANGASGNDVGLYNPRFTAERNAQSDYFTSAFSTALRIFESLSDIDFNPCGALHLVNDEKKAKRFNKTVQNWGWNERRLRMVNAKEASDIAGVLIQHDAMYLSQSGCVSPRKLCKAYMRGVDYHINAKIENLEEVTADAIILASGSAIADFQADFQANLPIGTVRGQITHVKSTAQSKALNTSVCYGGYMSPSLNDTHIVGSSFQRWLNHTDIIPQDDEDNLAKLSENVPTLAQGLEIIGQRASIRATSKDHFPIVGALSKNTYISGAHGSHGILSALAAAHLLTDMILQRPYSLGKDTVQALSPERFSNL